MAVWENPSDVTVDNSWETAKYDVMYIFLLEQQTV